jgi:hypothetical protein
MARAVLLISVWLFALGLTAASFMAEEDPCLDRTVAVNVQAEDQRSVTGLTASNFRGKIHGKPVQIVSVSYDTAPRRIVILLDASGSMADKWALELNLVYRVVSSAPNQTAFALLTFSNQVEDKYDFTQNPAVVEQELIKLKRKTPHGKTALLDSLLAAVNLLRPANRGDAIFLVSDGGESASKSSERVVKDAILQSASRVFTFLMLDSILSRGRTLEEVDGPALVGILAQTTGGDLFTFYTDRGGTDPKRIPPAVRAMAQEISEFYSLQIKLPETLNKPRDWKLEVVDPESKKLPDLRVIYPHMLAACQ